MNPDTTLAEIRRIIARIDANLDHGRISDIVTDVALVIRRFEELDEWCMLGNRLPADWARGKRSD